MEAGVMELCRQEPHQEAHHHLNVVRRCQQHRRRDAVEIEHDPVVSCRIFLEHGGITALATKDVTHDLLSALDPPADRMEVRGRFDLGQKPGKVLKIGDIHLDRIVGEGIAVALLDDRPKGISTEPLGDRLILAVEQGDAVTAPGHRGPARADNAPVDLEWGEVDVTHLSSLFIQGGQTEYCRQV